MREAGGSAAAARARATAMASVVGVAGLGGLLSLQTAAQLDRALETRRSFFGLLRVLASSEGGPGGSAMRLYDGSTMHGLQFVRPELRRVPTTYYSSGTGVGHAFETHGAGRPRRMGVVGLGAGTLAAYATPRDHLRFYEINPDVVEVATRSFTFLEGCPARWEIALGDARLSLEREPPQGFDLVVLDAFSSDSIPVHLLTVEAFAVWERHLRPDGILAIHISNHYLDLSAVVYGAAHERGLRALRVDNRERLDRATLSSSWMFLSRDVAALDALVAALEPLRESGDAWIANRPEPRHEGFRPWTDGYSDLFRILR